MRSPWCPKMCDVVIANYPSLKEMRKVFPLFNLRRDTRKCLESVQASEQKYYQFRVKPSPKGPNIPFNQLHIYHRQKYPLHWLPFVFSSLVPAVSMLWSWWKRVWLEAYCKMIRSYGSTSHISIADRNNRADCSGHAANQSVFDGYQWWFGPGLSVRIYSPHQHNRFPWLSSNAKTWINTRRWGAFGIKS